MQGPRLAAGPSTSAPTRNRTPVGSSTSIRPGMAGGFDGTPNHRRRLVISDLRRRQRFGPDLHCDKACHHRPNICLRQVWSSPVPMPCRSATTCATAPGATSRARSPAWHRRSTSAAARTGPGSPPGPAERSYAPRATPRSPTLPTLPPEMDNLISPKPRQKARVTFQLRYNDAAGGCGCVIRLGRSARCRHGADRIPRMLAFGKAVWADAVGRRRMAGTSRHDCGRCVMAPSSPPGPCGTGCRGWTARRCRPPLQNVSPAAIAVSVGWRAAAG